MARGKTELGASATRNAAGNGGVDYVECFPLNKAMEALHVQPSFMSESAINLNMPKKMMSEAIRAELAQLEADLEDTIVDLILDGQWEILQPNSGKSVVLGDGKSLSLAYRVEPGSAYRTWEWHGHVMIYENGEGYVPEYVYGNYFEPLDEEDEYEGEDEYEEMSMSPLVGLGGIISGVERRAPYRGL